MLIPKTWSCVGEIFEKKHRLVCGYGNRDYTGYRCGYEHFWKHNRKYPCLSQEETKPNNVGYACDLCKSWFCCRECLVDFHQEKFRDDLNLTTMHYRFAVKYLQNKRENVFLNTLYVNKKVYYKLCLICRKSFSEEKFTSRRRLMCIKNVNVTYDTCQDCINNQLYFPYEFEMLKESVILILATYRKDISSNFSMVPRDIMKLIVQWCFTKPYVFKYE